MIKHNASRPRRRTAAPGNGTKRNGRTVSLLTTGFLLFSLSEAHLDSIGLRYESRTKSPVLLWPSYDFSIDSAALLGPSALCVRGGANESESKPEDSIASPTLAGETSSSSPETSVQDSATQQAETLRAGGATSKKYRYSFSLYQTGDGSETDPDGIPTRYLRMQGNERDLAAIALNKTLQWRREHDIDNLLAKPHSKFDLCKAVFPHYFIGRDKGNHILFVQRPALLDLEKAEAIGLSMDDLLMHYVYVNEYLWQILEAEDPFGEMTSVIDMTGIKIAVLRRKTLVAFVKKLVSTMDSHYPQRAHKTLVLNAPKWFNVLFKLLSPLMRESTKKKIEIHSRGRKQDAVLKKYLGEKATDVLPADMWSTSETGDDENTESVSVDTSAERFLQNELEQELRSFVSKKHANMWKCTDQHPSQGD
jgi:hypothetical protein